MLYKRIKLRSLWSLKVMREKLCLEIKWILGVEVVVYHLTMC